MKATWTISAEEGRRMVAEAERREAWSSALAAIDDAVDAAEDLELALKAAVRARNRLKAAVAAVQAHATKAGRPGAFYHRGLTSNLVPVLETRMATCLDCGGEPPPILDMVRRAAEQARSAEENLQWAQGGRDG